MAMDAKDLRTDSALSAPTNDGNASYNQSSTTLQSNRNKSYQDIGSNSLGKVESQTTRPCAIIGPDRVLPPPPTSDVYHKKPVDPWSCNDNVYRHQPNFTQKLPEYQQVRNISPRQTFQENMQRIMVPPSYNSTKNIEDSNLKNSKVDMPLELKYCDVPYTINPAINGQKSIRNSDIPLTSVNPAFARSVPPHVWANSVNARPLRPYGPSEFYQYPEPPNFSSPRPMSRPHRTVHDDSAQTSAERLYQDGNMRFKPYPTIKERYPQVRYDYQNSYPNTFHPHPPFPPQKYDLSKSIPPHPYSMYSQVPMRRIAEPILDSYQRSNQQTNFNHYHNQYIPPPYGSVPGNCIQNKMYTHPSEISAKPLTPNKLPYDINNKIYLEYENNRNKMYPPVDNMYYTDLNRVSKSDVALPMHPGLNMPYNMPPQYMYRKDIPMKTFDNVHYRSIDQNVHVNSPLLRHPLQFSPSGLVISPTDSNNSNDTIQTLQEDCGYVSQSSTASGRSIDSGNYRMHSEIYRKHETFYNTNNKKNPKQMSRSDSITHSSEKKNLDVRQFLQMWNEGEEEVTDNNNASINTNNFSTNSETISNQEQLYVLGLVNIPNEELSKYDHIQKISKLPENIKGYNSIELLDQYEQLVESPALRQSKAILRDYQMSPKAIVKPPPQLSRPVSPLDVEAKISQSVIHKEVGCNFEIKPCSPKMLNVEVATPVQNILNERAIEKVINFGIGNTSAVLPSITESPTTSCKMNSPFISNNDLMKSSNYTLQDLESNSGVCLASLPRLDSDIELNFPEINQQFIDANKVSSKSGNVNLDTTYANLLKPEDTEFVAGRETPKLSKYRKIKTYDSSSDDVCHSSAMNRTDSVIIKNPDNNRKHEEIASNVTTIMKENKESDTIVITKENTPNSPSLSKTVHNIEDSSNIAIDFSFNKINERHVYSSESGNLLEIMDIEQNDQKLEVSKCNDKESLAGSTKENKDNADTNLNTRYNNEISLCLPSCEDINLEAICDVKTNTETDNDANFNKNEHINEDILREDDRSKVSEASKQITDHCLGIPYSAEKENIELNLAFNGEQKKDNNATSNINENEAIYHEAASQDTDHFIVESSEVNINEPHHDNIDKSEYNKESMHQLQPEIVKTTNESVYFNTGFESNDDTVKLNENDTLKQKLLSNVGICNISTNDSLVKDSIVDQLLITENSQESQSLFRITSEDEKKCTLKMKNTAKDTTQNLYGNEKQSDLGESSHQVVSYNIELKSHLLDDENNLNFKPKHILGGNTLKQKLLGNVGICNISTNADDESKFRETSGEEKECTLKMKNIAKASTQNLYGNEKQSVLGESSHQVVSYNKELKCHLFDVEDNYNDCKPKHILDGSVGDEQVCDKENLRTDNTSDQFLGNQKSIKMEENNRLEIENAEMKSPTYIKIDFKEVEQKLNDIHKINVNNEGIEKDNTLSNFNNTLENEIICENQKTVNSENINFLNVSEIPSQDTDNDETSQKTETSENLILTLSQSNAEETQTPFEIASDKPENNPKYNIIAKNSSINTLESVIIEHSLDNNIKQILDIQETVEFEENLHYTNSQEMEQTLKENQLKVKENISSHELVTVEIDQGNIDNIMCKITKHFMSKYYSSRIQNLIMYNEGICEVIDEGSHETNRKILDRATDEDIQPIKLITDENIDRNIVQGNQNIPTKKGNSAENIQATILPLEHDSWSDDSECDLVNDSQKENNNKCPQSDRKMYNNYNEVKQTQAFAEKKLNFGASSRRTLKRSLSDSALRLYNNDNSTNEHSILREPKRRKLMPEDILDPDDSQDLSCIIQNNRRNSISAICNSQNVFILIDNDEEYVIAQDGDDCNKISFTEVSTAFCNPADAILNLCLSNEPENSINDNYVPDNLEPNCLHSLESEIVRDTWVEDVACVETIFNDDVAVDITISAPTSPKSLSREGTDDESSTYSDSENEHMVKIKEIYGDNLCVDDVQLMETLYKTPQMDVNKTLVGIESQNGQDICNYTVGSPIIESQHCNRLTKPECCFINNEIKELDDKENQIHESPSTYERNFTRVEKLDSNTYETTQEYSDYVIDSCKLSPDEYKASKNQDNGINYSISSSPEVSSTTSEEKNSSILLKITSVNGSRRSQINNVPDISNSENYKFTEIKDYSSNYRPLITKAAKKYIPPLKESQDLKVKLALPQKSLYKLKQLKMAKGEPLIPKTKHISNPIKHNVPKKIKPKFEDVLKSIDEIQFQRHREKNKKPKTSIPKVVIKKSENGSHYASSANKKKSYNPDLTGRKWQPWVFIERNELVDKMAQRNKVKAVYCHRKKTFVLAEKFKKYKSICTAKFVISQPNSDNASSGNLKYTIRLKHNY